ncbi:MAG TPA: hypothetical protein VGM76_17720 [Lacipirellulaceae bacterium]
MNRQGRNVTAGKQLSLSLDAKLAGYFAAAGAVSALAARQSDAAIVANTTVQSFGINGDVNIDFNNDGQTDFQIDHDRVNLNGTNLDYLQLDKNDINSADNPLPIDAEKTFPENGQPRNNDQKYLTDGGATGSNAGEYPAALTSGTMIGPSSSGVWEFQETDHWNGTQDVRRANRLIDEDHGQIDTALNTNHPANPPPGTPRFVGLNGQVRYLGVAIDLQDAGYHGNPLPTINSGTNDDDPLNYWYGWIGIKITNEADATGQVVGYAYENQLGQAIAAGDVGTPPAVPGDYNGDGIVNAADYTVWRDHLDQTFALPNRDGTNSGKINSADYTYWVNHFGQHSGGTGAGINDGAVPESSSLLMATIGGLVLFGAFIVRSMIRNGKARLRFCGLFPC